MRKLEREKRNQQKEQEEAERRNKAGRSSRRSREKVCFCSLLLFFPKMHEIYKIWLYFIL